jgi:hypothetical protein
MPLARESSKTARHGRQQADQMPRPPGSDLYVGRAQAGGRRLGWVDWLAGPKEKWLWDLNFEYFLNYFDWKLIWILSGFDSFGLEKIWKTFLNDF